jgi:hypothetical protein
VEVVLISIGHMGSEICSMLSVLANGQTVNKSSNLLEAACAGSERNVTYL